MGGGDGRADGRGDGRDDGRDENRRIPLFKGLSTIRREGWGTFVKESTKIRKRQIFVNESRIFQHALFPETFPYWELSALYLGTDRN